MAWNVGDQIWGGYVYWVDPTDNTHIKVAKDVHIAGQNMREYTALNSSPSMYPHGYQNPGASKTDGFNNTTAHISEHIANWPGNWSGISCASKSVFKFIHLYNGGSMGNSSGQINWYLPAIDEAADIMDILGPYGTNPSFSETNGFGQVKQYMTSSNVTEAEHNMWPETPITTATTGGPNGTGGTELLNSDGSSALLTSSISGQQFNPKGVGSYWSITYNSASPYWVKTVKQKCPGFEYNFITAVEAYNVTPPCDCAPTSAVNCAINASAIGANDGTLALTMHLDPNCTYPITVECVHTSSGTQMSLVQINNYSSTPFQWAVSTLMGGEGYTFQGDDANGCNALNVDTTMCVQQPFNCSEIYPALDTPLTNDPTINGGNDGSVDVNFSWYDVGGNPLSSIADTCNLSVKLYFDPNGANTLINQSLITNTSVSNINISSLTAGDYHLYIEDCRGCNDELFFTLVDPKDPCFGTIYTNSTTIITQNSCGSNLNIGAIDITPTWGTGPYSIVQTSGPGGLNVNNITGTHSLTNLTDGSYSFLITDSVGCYTTDTASLICVPCSVDISGTINNPLCSGDLGSYDVLATSTTSGNITYTYELTGTMSLSPVSGQLSTYTFSNLLPGNYTVNVTEDNTGCQNQISFSIVAPSILVLTSIVSNVTMYGLSDGSITLSASGGSSPYSYLWNDGSTGNSLTGLTAGTYTVEVTDINGCLIEEEFIITEPECDLLVSGSVTGTTDSTTSDGSINIYPIIGGFPPYTYSWTGTGGYTATTADISDLATGYYTLEVCDSLGCCESVSFYVMPGDCISSSDTDKVVNYLNSILQRCGCESPNSVGGTTSTRPKTPTRGIRTQFNTYVTKTKIGNIDYTSSKSNNNSNPKLTSIPSKSKELAKIVDSPVFKESDVPLIEGLENSTKLADTGYVKGFTEKVKSLVNSGLGYIYDKLVFNNSKFASTLLNKRSTEIVKLEDRDIKQLEKELKDSSVDIVTALKEGRDASKLTQSGVYGDTLIDETTSDPDGYEQSSNQPSPPSDPPEDDVPPWDPGEDDPFGEGDGDDRGADDEP